MTPAPIWNSVSAGRKVGTYRGFSIVLSVPSGVIQYRTKMYREGLKHFLTTYQPPESDAKIVADYAAGYTIAEIEKRHGMSLTSVTTILRAYKAKRPDSLTVRLERYLREHGPASIRQLRAVFPKHADKTIYRVPGAFVANWEAHPRGNKASPIFALGYGPDCPAPSRMGKPNTRRGYTKRPPSPLAALPQRGAVTAHLAGVSWLR